MVIYSVIAVVYGLFALFSFGKRSKRKKRRYWVTVIVLMPLLILTALRGTTVGNDTFMYLRAYNYFSQLDSMKYAVLNTRFEPGFAILNYVSSHIGISYINLQILMSLFIYLSLARFISKYSDNIWLSCYVFLTLRFAFGPMNVVRMWIAVAILSYAIPLIENRKTLRFVLLVIAAGMFHYSAFIFIFFPLFSRIKWNTNRIWLLMIASVGILTVATPLFTFITRLIGRYSGYLDSVYFSENNVGTYLSFAIDLAFFILIYLEKKERRRINKYGRYSYVVPEGDDNTKKESDIVFAAILIAIALDIIGLSNSIMNRLSNYYRIFFLLAIPEALLKIRIRSNAWIIKSFIIFALAVQFIIVITYRPHWSGVIPYLFFWE